MAPTTSNSSRTGSAAGIQVIARAAQVLRALDSDPGGLGLAELAARVGLPRSTVYRIVASLAAEGLVVAPSSNGRVRLGPELVRLAEASRHDRWQGLRPHMQKVFDALDETVDCAVLEGDQLRLVDQIPATHGFRAVSVVGSTSPLHCTANGKSLLSALDDDEVIGRFPDRLEPYTPNTLTSRDELLAELRAVRKSGVAYDREEHTLGISSVAISVHAPRGTPAALSVLMPTTRFAHNEREVVRVLLRVRREIAATWSSG
jgi:IclR family transcriptional regulator, acetate operon repressor